MWRCRLDMARAWTFFTACCWKPVGGARRRSPDPSPTSVIRALGPPSNVGACGGQLGQIEFCAEELRRAARRRHQNPQGIHPGRSAEPSFPLLHRKIASKGAALAGRLKNINHCLGDQAGTIFAASLAPAPRVLDVGAGATAVVRGPGLPGSRPGGLQNNRIARGLSCGADIGAIPLAGGTVDQRSVWRFLPPERLRDPLPVLREIRRVTAGRGRPGLHPPVWEHATL